MKPNETGSNKDLILAPAARRDLLEIWGHIAADNPDAADRMSERFSIAFQQLQSYPLSGRSRSDLAGTRDLRFWHVGNYQVIYRVTEARVEIAAVLHGSRDIPAVLRERGDEGLDPSSGEG